MNGTETGPLADAACARRREQVVHGRWRNVHPHPLSGRASTLRVPQNATRRRRRDAELARRPSRGLTALGASDACAATRVGLPRYGAVDVIREHVGVRHELEPYTMFGERPLRRSSTIHSSESGRRSTRCRCGDPCRPRRQFGARSLGVAEVAVKVRLIAASGRRPDHGRLRRSAPMCREPAPASPVPSAAPGGSRSWMTPSPGPILAQVPARSVGRVGIEPTTQGL